MTDVVWLEKMLDEIRAKEVELSNLKKAANTFYRAKDLPAPFADTEPQSPTGTIRLKADEFYGKGFSTAARAYLDRRKEATSAEDILRAMEQGGFDFEAIGWKDENRVRTVAMSLAKNSQIFHRLPSGTFGLREWYPDVIEKKKGKKGDSESGEDES